MPSHLYTGPTDAYGPPTSAFPGPHVLGAPVVAVTVRPVGPAQGPKRPATCLLVANASDRGPRILQATVDTAVTEWTVHPNAQSLAGAGVRRVTTALNAAGIPARQSPGGAAATDIPIATRSGTRTLRLSVGDGAAHWHLVGTEAGGTWRAARPDDVAVHVRRWLAVAKAKPMP